MYQRVTKKETSIARQRATTLIRNVQAELKDKYVFMPRLVGSGAWGTMIKDGNGEYDLDYQLILTKNSPLYKKENKFPSPTVIKSDFLKAFITSAKRTESFEN